MVVEIGLITPPVGMNVYIINSLARDVPMSETFRGVVPFLIAGAVALGLKSAEEVFAEGQKLLSKTSGKAQLLIQEMVLGTEVLLGARTDPQYGPFLMVGLGGIFVEVLKDVAIRLLPVDEREAREMLKELRSYKVLEGVRGQGPRDVDALLKAMVGLSGIFAAHRNHLSDMEINPIMVRAQGGGVAAVDVRLVRK